MTTYERGDILANNDGERKFFTLVIHNPSQRQDDRYTVLDLILEPSPLEKGDSIIEKVFKIPRRALREPQDSAVDNQSFQKIDHVDLEEKVFSGYAFGDYVGMPDLPQLDQYFRVQR